MLRFTLGPKPIIASGLVVLVTGVAVYAIRARQPLSVRSTSGLDDVLQGDARDLMVFASERERTEEGLTVDKLQAVLDRLVKPYVGHVDPKAPLGTNDDTGGFHAMSERTVFARSGARVPLAFEAWMNEKECFTPVLTTVLYNSWLLRFVRKGGESVPGAPFRAALQGVRQDRAFLTSLGFKGLTSKHPDHPLIEWDEIETHNRGILAQTP